MNVCRACGTAGLFCYLPLGDHPAANAFPRRSDLAKPDVRYPLNTHVCLNCALIQVADPLPADFYVDYVYVPSGSTTMPVHFASLAERFRDQLATAPGELVVDIGCNDGLLLSACRDLGLEALGVDPSANIAELARAKGVEVFNQYFTQESSRQVLDIYGPAKVIVTTNTLNHIDDLHDFMAGINTLLAADGTFVIEVPQALTCIELDEFDTVYHEHLSIFSVSSVQAIGKPFGLQIVDIDDLPIHGGSMRLYLRREGPVKSVVNDWIERERRAGLFERETYVAHAGRVALIRSGLMSMLQDLKRQGKRVAGYGAPAKGNTMLNYVGIGPEILDYLADRNKLKQGRFSPGMRIPVVDPLVIYETNPDYLLILAWNFAEEIIEQLAPYRAAGGKLILPIPTPRILD